MNSTVENQIAVAVVGLGYIGLPTAAFLASSGAKVHGVDVNESHVNLINEGTVPFVEPGFESLLKKVISDGSLVASVEIAPADVFIVAVPTPFNDDRTVDDKFILSAGESISTVIQAGNLVVLESTSPPGLTEQLAKCILDRRPDLSDVPNESNCVYFAHAPERVLPGRIMEEMVSNDRIIGGTTSEASAIAKDLYARFAKGAIHLTDARTAELAKLTENSFRDVNIAFANELSMICDELKVDVWELISLANFHPRVNILQPGPGVGGHCIAVDPWFIVSAAPETAKLIRTAREVNDQKPSFTLEKVKEAVSNHSPNSLTVLGITFKPNIDDLRESPALALTEQFAESFPNLPIRVVDPYITDLPQKLNDYPNTSLVPWTDKINEDSLAVILVDHEEFLDLKDSLSRHSLVIDTRGIL